LTNEELKSKLVDFVNRNSKALGIEWDPQISEKLLFDPFNPSYPARVKTAHYFLLVASITETKLIGRAENSRAILIHFHRVLGDSLFTIKTASTFEDQLMRSAYYNELGLEKWEIPGILASINDYINGTAMDDIISYSKTFSTPAKFVQDIAENIERMKGVHIEKTWMYLRWMTRPSPDLHIFTHFSPGDLQIPMTSFIRAVSCCLGLTPDPESTIWNDIEEATKLRQAVTDYARGLFPDDPTKVDYPFFLLGRWLKGKDLCLTLLKEYLIFFADLYSRTQSSPVTYDLVSRQMSLFEERVRDELRRMGIMFYFESHRFQLTREISYLPDFVLPNCRIARKRVLLEPHGIWSHPKSRKARIGGKTMTFHAYERTPDELKFTEKMRLFRETFGKDYHVILLVPARVKGRVERWYPDSFDEIFEGRDIPDLLFKLAKIQK